MIYLGKNNSGKNIQLSEIAKSEGISMKYLEKIVQILKRAGLVRVTRGSKGGYRLGKPLEKIILNEIFSVLEGSTSILDCIDSGYCNRETKCSGIKLWEGLSNVITQYLSGQSLSDLVNKPEENNMYYI